MLRRVGLKGQSIFDAVVCRLQRETENSGLASSEKCFDWSRMVMRVRLNGYDRSVSGIRCLQRDLQNSCAPSVWILGLKHDASCHRFMTFLVHKGDGQWGTQACL